MDWKQLEQLIQDRKKRYTANQVEQLSTELLQSLDEQVQPLQAARMAYALTLLQLRSKKHDEKKSLRFFHHLRKILIHEIQVAEAEHDEESHEHLIYVRKLAEQYFHHLMTEARKHKLEDVEYLAKQLRKKNHEKLLKLQHGKNIVLRREQQIIQKLAKKHYLFAGFLLAISLYFAWTSFWHLLDVVVEQWVFSEWSSANVATVLRQVLMLTFSVSFLWAFVAYQHEEQLVPQED